MFSALRLTPYALRPTPYALRLATTILRKTFLIFLTTVGLAWVAQAQEKGHIQVKCPPGTQIFLDGTLKGIASADIGGLILQDVPAGPHTIRAIKRDFALQDKEVQLDPGEVFVVEFAPFVPMIHIEQRGQEAEADLRAKVGDLVIQSIPIECRIECSALKISEEESLDREKLQDKLRIENIPIGVYTISFSALEKKLVHEIRMCRGDTIRLMVNFIDGTVDKNVTALLPSGMTLDLVWIQPGMFTMGSPSSERRREDHEGPQHEVKIAKGFYLGKYELTQEQWTSITGTGPWLKKDHARDDEDRPAVYISWKEARVFIDLLNEGEGPGVYRLPTEAEWEYACRAEGADRWSFGDDQLTLEEYAWYWKNAWNAEEQYAHEVGRKSPNSWGLYDMHGNVYEWVEDWYAPDYYSVSPEEDPPGPASGTARVIRGGGFGDRAWFVRSASRYSGPPDHRGVSVGVRLVRQGR